MVMGAPALSEIFDNMRPFREEILRSGRRTSMARSDLASSQHPQIKSFSFPLLLPPVGLCHFISLTCTHSTASCDKGLPLWVFVLPMSSAAMPHQPARDRPMVTTPWASV